MPTAESILTPQALASVREEVRQAFHDAFEQMGGTSQLPYFTVIRLQEAMVEVVARHYFRTKGAV